MTVLVTPVLKDNYLFHLSDGGDVAVIDPAEADTVQALAEARRWRPTVILNTHHHGDHVGGNRRVKELFGCKVIGPRGEAAKIPGLDAAVGEGDTVRVGGLTGRVLEVGGHTLGHVAYYFEAIGAVFCGDTLFSLGCGRLFEGTAEMMWASLAKLAALPAATKVYCAHEYTAANLEFALTVEPENEALRRRGDDVRALRAAGQATIPTTIGGERATNPFLRAASPDIRRRLGMEAAPDWEVFAAVRRLKDKFRG